MSIGLMDYAAALAGGTRTATPNGANVLIAEGNNWDDAPRTGKAV
jgi:hypothetical protein